MTKTLPPRPLSPHLQVYKPQMTSVLSILHRMAGFALSLGLLPFSCWLYHAAYNPEGLEGFYEFMGGTLGTLMLFGWSMAFYYHLANGIRHLLWDAGKLLDIGAATRSGWFVLGTTLGMTAVTWIYLLTGEPV